MVFMIYVICLLLSILKDASRILILSGSLHGRFCLKHLRPVLSVVCGCSASGAGLARIHVCTRRRDLMVIISLHSSTIIRYLSILSCCTSIIKVPTKLVT